MAALSEAVSLLFRIRADGSNAKAELKLVESEVAKFSKGVVSHADEAAQGFLSRFGAVGTGLSALEGPAAIAAIAIAAVGAAVVGVSEKLFSLAESAAKLGSSFASFQNMTGLTAESVSTLNHVAELSGKSLTDLQQPMLKFSQYVEKAGGNVNDLDGEFSKAIDHLRELPAGIERMNAASEIFGARGAKTVLSMLSKMPEGFDEAKKHAEEFGEVLSQKDIDAAKDFTRAMATIESQVKITAAKFALEYTPQITAALKSISQFLADNKDVAARWGHDVSNILEGVGNAFWALTLPINDALKDINSALGTNLNQWDIWGPAVSAVVRTMVFEATGGLSEVLIILGKINQAMKDAAGLNLGAGVANIGPKGDGSAGDDVFNKPSTGFGGLDVDKLNNAGGSRFGGAGGGGRGGGGSRGGGGAKSNAAARATTDLQADIAIHKEQLADVEKVYKETLERIRAEFDKTGDDTALSDGAKAAADAFSTGSTAMIATLETLEKKKAALEKETQHQTELRQKHEADRRAGIADEVVKENQKTNEKISDADKKLADDRLKFEEDIANQLEDIRAVSAQRIIQADEDDYDSQLADAEGFSQRQNEIRQDAYEAIQPLLQAEFDHKNDLLDQEEAAAKENARKLIKNEAELQEELQRIDDLYHNRKLLGEGEFQKQLKALQDKYLITTPVSKGAQSGFQTFFQTFANGVAGYLKNVVLVEDANGELHFSFAQMFKTLGDMALQAFGQLAAGFGQMVENWVLYGDQAGNSMRKMVAQILAQVAMTATTYAILCLAAAALATTAFGAALLGGTPAQFLQGAALFGAVAIGAAIAGRLVAGDAFKKQTATSTGNVRASSGQGSGQNQGGVYSSQKEQVIDAARNQPSSFIPRAVADITVRVVSTKDHIIDVIKTNVNNNGDLRTLILDNAY